MARDSQAALVARGAAKLMAADDDPRIGALAFDGWDTHANVGGPIGFPDSAQAKPMKGLVA